MKENIVEILRQIIVDFHAANLPVPSEREECVDAFSKGVRKAITLTGMRRSGKTWILYQRIQKLLATGLDRRKILYLNFEDDRLRPFAATDCQAILDAYFSLYPDFADQDDLYFFFDEIQEVEGWESFVRRLLDNERMNTVLTGSSSKMFSREIATSLRGRTLTREVFPFSFREYLHYKGVRFDGKLTTKQLAALRHHRETYQTFGGFPEAVIMKPEYHRELLQGYIETVIYRDIIERHHTGNAAVVREFVSYCIQNSASLLSINRIYQRFKSMGRQVSKDLFYGLMENLEDVFCLFSVPMFSHSVHERARNSKKIYCVDPGLITAYSIKPTLDRAARLETLVFNGLRRKTRSIFYVKTSSGNEVDFLAIYDDGKRELIQATVSMANPETASRETRAITEAIDELKIPQATIITEDEEERTISIHGKKIRILPVWRWLIEC